MLGMFDACFAYEPGCLQGKLKVSIPFQNEIGYIDFVGKVEENTCCEKDLRCMYENNGRGDFFCGKWKCA